MLNRCPMTAFVSNPASWDEAVSNFEQTTNEAYVSVGCLPAEYRVGARHNVGVENSGTPVAVSELKRTGNGFVETLRGEVN